MKNMFGMCINRNVVIGLAVVGLGLFLIAPGLAAAALPLLVLAVCPLSMGLMALLMGRGMRQRMSGVQGNQCSLPEPGVSTAPEQRLDELRKQLQQAQEQQDIVASQIAELEMAIQRGLDSVEQKAEPILTRANYNRQTD